jgi:hypothetical protein
MTGRGGAPTALILGMLHCILSLSYVNSGSVLD